MSEIGAVVKAADGVHFPVKSAVFSKSPKGLSLCFLCSGQHVKYQMPCGFPLTSSLLLDYHVSALNNTYTPVI